jgi:hypothetical protein
MDFSDLISFAKAIIVVRSLGGGGGLPWSYSWSCDPFGTHTTSGGPEEEREESHSIRIVIIHGTCIIITSLK